MMAKVRTCLWFAGRGEEAAEFYVSLLADSRIEQVLRSVPEGGWTGIDFILAGAPFQILDVTPQPGLPDFRLTPAVSIVVTPADQQETDRLWAALTADGGEESMCGWLTDRFGVSWQVAPAALYRMLADPDRAAAGRAHAAILPMRKIDIATVEAAFAGEVRAER